MSNNQKTYKLYDMPWYIFAAFAAIVMVAAYMERLPGGMIGAYAFCWVVGVILMEIGDRTPIINSYFGGGAIVAIFGAAAIVSFEALPASAIELSAEFVSGGGFLDYFIAALICGSILGMNRKLLMSASLRYLPAIFGGLIVAVALTGLVGALIGYGAQEAILFIAIPIMGGGMGAGAIPLSEIFGSNMGVDSGEILAIMVPALALGNALAIFAGGLLDRLGKVKKNLTGDGELVEKGANTAEEDSPEFTAKRNKIELMNLGKGLMISATFFVLGRILQSFVPDIHSYAWMIISVAVCKIFNIIPDDLETACYQWYQFMVKTLMPVLLICVGFAYTNFDDIMAAFSLEYLLLVGTTVIGSIIGAGFVGKLVGFYPIESAITAGLCMANMGGSGDVAVLSAANRMELMPFAQISSRIGGAFILLLSSFVLQFMF